MGNLGDNDRKQCWLLTTMFIMLIFTVLLFPYTTSHEVQDVSDAMEYLSRFGYIGKDIAFHMNIIDATDVIKQFQHMAGINETGDLDPETVRMMNTPRCGNKDLDEEMIPDPDDKLSNNQVRRRKRFRLNEYGAKWRKRDLTYRVPKFSSSIKVPPELVERDVDRAFQLWQGVTNLNFIKSTDRHVDIELDFAKMRHHDDFPFDGPGKTLAHAFPPGSGIGGDVHFDESETWSVDSPRGTNVLFVATHEIGHALGLSHSDKKGAIMQAFYGGYRPMLKLHDDDVDGIQSLYGKREIPLPPPPPQNQPRFSSTSPIDSNRLTPIIQQWNRFVTTPRSRSRFETINNRDSNFNVQIITLRPSSAPAIATPWWKSTPAPAVTTSAMTQKVTESPLSGAPDLCVDPTFDTITTLSDGNIYVFKGYYVFRIDEKDGGIVPGWPVRIDSKFNGLEGNLDASLTRPNGKTFFFKGGKYWRSTGFQMDGNAYPRSIDKHFPGIPDYVDAAFENPKSQQMYFMKGDKLWRFNPFPRSGPHVSDTYPVSITTWGLPLSGIDASFSTSSGDVYFFKGDNFWKFDTIMFRVANANPPYPRSVKQHWFGCSGINKNSIRNLRQQSNYLYHHEIYN